MEQSYPKEDRSATSWRNSISARILRFLGPYRGHFALGLILMILFGATDGAVPFMVKYVLDGVFSSGDQNLLLILPPLLLAFAAARGALDFGQQYVMAKVGLRIVRDIRNAVNRHLLKLSSDFFLANSSADLVSRLTSDTILIRTLLTDAVAAIIRDSVRIMALLAAAIYLDPVLAAIAFIAFPIGIIPVYRFGRRMRKLSRVGQETTGLISSLLQESTLGNRVVKIFTREEFELRKFESENDKLTRTLEKAEKIKALVGPVNEVLAAFAIGGVVLYGGYSVIQDLRTQGEFLAFLVAVFLLYDPFKKLSRVNSVVQQSLAGAERIFEILDTEPSIAEPVHPLRLPTGNSIEFVDVDFSYREHSSSGVQREEDREVLALRGINLMIEEGRKVALVGFSGAGKSTVVDLIARFIDPRRGTVKIGGVDISKVSLRELRGRIAMVSQHTFLFHDTIFANIAYGVESATQEQVESVARAAYAHDFITAMPLGYQTLVGEGGFALSGGERQRIAIARALLKNSPILILDEATASLDNRAEREVQLALEALERGRTTIVIAHRLSTVRDADLIVVLKDGRIVEKGTHDELLKLGGEFSKLFALQFRDPSASGDSLIN